MNTSLGRSTDTNFSDKAKAMSMTFSPTGAHAVSQTDPGRAEQLLQWLQRTNTALSHDFCPGANRWVYWLKSPLWSLLLASGISLLCGVFLKTEALFITAILLVIAAVGVALPWLAMRGIDVHLTFDARRGRVGQAVLVRLRVRNRWPWPIWGLSLMRGFAVQDTSDTDEGVSLARVPGWSTAEYSWSFVPKVRGRYPLVAPEIETGFPFGLYRACRKATVDGHVVVWPKTVMLAGLPDAVESNQSDDQLADRRVGDFGDMLGTRAFRNGDSLRRVHWAQTARQQQMIVCERQAPATSSVRVTLDIDSASHPDVAANERDPKNSLELAVQVAASVCESLHRQYCRVELSIHDQLLVAGESAASFQRLMDVLSQTTLVEHQRTAGRRSLAGRRSQSQSFDIVITTPHGISGRGAKRQGQHVISVANTCTTHDTSTTQGTSTTHRLVSEHAMTSVKLCSGAWISLSQSADAGLELQRQWKGACDVR